MYFGYSKCSTVLWLLLHLTPAAKTGFPKWGRLMGGQFGQNGQELHENDKISIFESKQWGGGGMGGQANSLSSGRDPPSPPTRETLKDNPFTRVGWGLQDQIVI